MTAEDRYHVALGQIMRILARQDPATRARLITVLSSLEQLEDTDGMFEALADCDAIFMEHFA